jgi:hypothetical protein
MIDTDQYEGHLPFTGDEMVWIWSKSGMNRMKSVKQFHVTARLLEDAPALLAEVKRLREQLLQGVMYMHMTATQTKDGRIYNAKKFERQVRELIE